MRGGFMEELQAEKVKESIFSSFTQGMNQFLIGILINDYLERQGDSALSEKAAIRTALKDVIFKAIETGAMQTLVEVEGVTAKQSLAVNQMIDECSEKALTAYDDMTSAIK